MTEDQTISRGAVMQAVRTLGLEPQEVTMVFIDSYDVEVFYVEHVAEKKNKKFESFLVI